MATIRLYRLSALIFSLRWSAPPLFSQHYQANLLTDTILANTRLQSRITLCAIGDHPNASNFLLVESNLRLQVLTSKRGLGFGLGLEIPVRSQLLRESLLISFPPLTYMLKFSG